MIERLYVDNYRCLVDFEWRPRRSEILLGRNGSGKTTIFAALRSLQRAMEGARISSVFTRRDRTAWLKKSRATFEIDLRWNSQLYRYRLELVATPSVMQVERELLDVDGRRVFEFSKGEAHVVGKDSSPAARLLASTEFSVLSLVPGEHDLGREAGAFRSALAGIHVLRPDPMKMSAISRAPTRRLLFNFGNFASWYRGVSEAEPSRNIAFLGHLRQVLDGFQELRFVEGLGDRQRLDAVFSYPEKAGRSPGRYALPITKLSDGQRSLLASYAALEFLACENETLCLDEPDNYVALAEIQPWLIALTERIGEANGQLLIASHHPEVIDFMTPDAATLFDRPEGESVRARPLVLADVGLSASEVIARGWEDG